MIKVKVKDGIANTKIDGTLVDLIAETATAVVSIGDSMDTEVEGALFMKAVVGMLSKMEKEGYWHKYVCR